MKRRTKAAIAVAALGLVCALAPATASFADGEGNWTPDHSTNTSTVVVTPSDGEGNWTPD